MVEPISASLGAVVAALVVKAAEKAGEAAVEGGAGALRRLVAAVRHRFASAGDAQAEAVLERVEDSPVGDKHRDALAEAIDSYAADDGGWAEQLRALVGEADRGGVDVSGVVQQVYGDHNVTIADVKYSTVIIHELGPAGSAAATWEPVEALVLKQELRRGADADRRVWPRLDADAVVALAVPFPVIVGLRPDRDAEVRWTGGPLLLPGEETLVEVELLLHGFAIGEGKPAFTLWARPENPYPSVKVVLVAESDRELAEIREVGVVYRIGGQLRGYAARRIRVVAGPRDIDFAERPASPEVRLADITRPVADDGEDLNIVIQRGDDTAGQMLVFSCSSSLVAVPEVTESSRSDWVVAIGDDPAAFRNAVVATGDRAQNPRALFNQLTGHGLTVGSKLPPVVQEALRRVMAARAPEPASILIASTESNIPWELSVLDPPAGDGRDDVTPFLGARAVVGRWLLHVDRPPADPPRSTIARDAVVVSAIYDGVPGWGRLIEAEEEAAAVVARLATPPALQPNYDVVLDCLENRPPADLLHFALHGRFARDDDDRRDGLVLLAPDPRQDGEMVEEFLTPADVSPKTLQRSPMVFLNACQVGAGRTVLGDYAGMAAAFLQSGASAVIAPLWSVDDGVARDLALDFYESLVSGGNKGLCPAEFLRQRRAAHTPLSVQADASANSDSRKRLRTELAYQFFGHPRYRVRWVTDSTESRDADG